MGEELKEQEWGMELTKTHCMYVSSSQRIKKKKIRGLLLFPLHSQEEREFEQE